MKNVKNGNCVNGSYVEKRGYFNFNGGSMMKKQMKTMLLATLVATGAFVPMQMKADDSGYGKMHLFGVVALTGVAVKYVPSMTSSLINGFNAYFRRQAAINNNTKEATRLAEKQKSLNQASLELAKAELETIQTDLTGVQELLKALELTEDESAGSISTELGKIKIALKDLNAEKLPDIKLMASNAETVINAARLKAKSAGIEKLDAYTAKFTETLKQQTAAMQKLKADGEKQQKDLKELIHGKSYFSFLGF